MKLSSRRAEVLSGIALVLQLLFFLLVFLIGYRVNSLAVKIEAWHFLGGVAIWLILLLQFRQRRLAEEERLDAEQYESLKREGKDTSVFEGVIAQSNLNLAARRLVWLEKYLIVAFAVMVGGYLLGMGFWLFSVVRASSLSQLKTVNDALLQSSAFLAGIALVSFLFSCYAIGMSREKEWRPLRAGGSYLFFNALVSFALTAMLLMAQYGYTKPVQVSASILSLVFVVLGAEIFLNILLDAFRPRVRGRYRTAAYESRLLDLFSEPGGILRTAAHTIDYQFGFKVSETWFYRLLERAVVPLLIIQAICLYLLTSIAIVDTGSVGVLERWGKPLNVNHPYQPGIHLKYPWPIDVVRSFPVQKVQIIDVGFERKAPKIVNGREVPDLSPILWTTKHWKHEYPFMVATGWNGTVESGMADNGAGGTPVQKGSVTANSSNAKGSNTKSQRAVAGYGSGNTEPQFQRNDFDLLVLGLVVHYRISNIAQYAYSNNCFRNPRQILQDICNREAVIYCARSNLEKLMGPERRKTTIELQNAIQKQIDKRQLGVEVLFVGLESVHPPLEVAAAFEKVVSALQTRQAAVLKARGKARAILSKAEGDMSVQIAAAKAYAYERAHVAQAISRRFSQQLEAYDKGGQIYLEREYLSVLDKLLPDMRKYVVSTKNINSRIFEFDLKEKLQPSLFDVGILNKKQESSK